MAVVFFLSVFLIAACGLIYELIAGALASYLLGDSILQFSTVIGTYLFAMGIGSWLSKFIGRGLVASPNDFGVKGDAPTHPELLDYLAVRFAEEGWSVK